MARLKDMLLGHSHNYDNYDNYDKYIYDDWDDIQAIYHTWSLYKSAHESVKHVNVHKYTQNILN